MKRARTLTYPGFGRRLGGGVSWEQIRPYAVQAAVAAGKYAAGKIGDRVFAKPKSSSSFSAVTTQHDIATRYRRKRMPKYRRKRWKKFTRRVNHVIMQQQNLQSITIDDIGGVVSWTSDTQATDGVLLGGVNAGAQSNELLRMFQAKFGGLTTTSAAMAGRKLFLKAICLDIQLTNTGASGVIIDVYHLLARKGYNGTTTTGTGASTVVEGVPLNSQYAESFADSSTMTIGTVDAFNPATTPFQNSAFCSLWRIVSKKQVLLGSGQVTTMQFRNPRNKMLDGKVLEMHPSQLPGYTVGILFQFRGVPINDAGTARLAAGSITWKGQKTLSFGVPPGSTSVDQTAQL